MILYVAQAKGSWYTRLASHHKANRNEARRGTRSTEVKRRNKKRKGKRVDEWSGSKRSRKLAIGNDVDSAYNRGKAEAAQCYGDGFKAGEAKREASSVNVGEIWTEAYAHAKLEYYNDGYKAGFKHACRECRIDMQRFSRLASDVLGGLREVPGFENPGPITLGKRRRRGVAT